MKAETVEVIEATDRQRGIASLTLAFSSDPVMRWAWPDPGTYLTYWPRFAEGFGGQAFDDGTAYGLKDCLAVALWMRPGVGPDEETVMRVMGESLDDQILKGRQRLVRADGRATPHDRRLVFAADRSRLGRAGQRPGRRIAPTRDGNV
jgi:hypothetical protein